MMLKKSERELDNRDIEPTRRKKTSLAWSRDTDGLPVHEIAKSRALV